jgi:hypothetical protein
VSTFEVHRQPDREAETISCVICPSAVVSYSPQSNHQQSAASAATSVVTVGL